MELYTKIKNFTNKKGEIIEYQAIFTSLIINGKPHEIELLLFEKRNRILKQLLLDELKKQ